MDFFNVGSAHRLLGRVRCAPLKRILSSLVSPEKIFSQFLLLTFIHFVVGVRSWILWLFDDVRKQSKAAFFLSLSSLCVLLLFFWRKKKVTWRDEIFIFLIIHATAAAAATVAAVAYLIERKRLLENGHTHTHRRTKGSWVLRPYSTQSTQRTFL